MTDTMLWSDDTMPEKKWRLTVFALNGRVVERRELQPGTYTIGRCEDCDISLEQASTFVSRFHCEVTIPPESDLKPILRNLSKSNGTKVNGERIDLVEVGEHDVIVIGDLRMMIFFG